jgi:AcrR family transcriptional regulator
LRNSTVDRRVSKTKRLLNQALVKLLMEKDLKNVTVLELTEAADVNRGTFYLHYKDIYDLYDQIENDVLNKFNSLITKHMNQSRPGIAYTAVADAFKFLHENADACRVILRINGNFFLSKLIDMLKPTAIKGWKTILGKENEEFYDYYYSFITSGCVGMMRAWFDGGMKEPPEKVAKLAEQLMINSLKRPK